MWSWWCSLVFSSPIMTTMHHLQTTRECHTHRPQWDLPAVRPDGVLRPGGDPTLGSVVLAGSDLPLSYRKFVHVPTGSEPGEKPTEWACLIEQRILSSTEVLGLLLLHLLRLRVPAGKCLHLLHPAWDQREDPGGDLSRVQRHHRLWAPTLAA